MELLKTFFAEVVKNSDFKLQLEGRDAVAAILIVGSVAYMIVDRICDHREKKSANVSNTEQVFAVVDK